MTCPPGRHPHSNCTPGRRRRRGDLHAPPWGPEVEHLGPRGTDSRGREQWPHQTIFMITLTVTVAMGTAQGTPSGTIAPPGVGQGWGGSTAGTPAQRPAQHRHAVRARVARKEDSRLQLCPKPQAACGLNRLHPRLPSDGVQAGGGCDLMGALGGGT